VSHFFIVSSKDLPRALLQQHNNNNNTHERRKRRSSSRFLDFRPSSSIIKSNQQVFQGQTIFIMRICSLSLSLWFLVETAEAFSPSVPRQFRALSTARLAADDDDEEKKENPYQDPNYPELEFVDYSDPKYQVDQGVGDEFFDASSTEEQVEAMREERRLKNDEFQFETYYRDVLRKGEEYKGEWIVYRTSTFMEGVDNDGSGMPRMTTAGEPLRVISSGERIELPDAPISDFSLDSARILHTEKLSPENFTEKTKEVKKAEEKIVSTTYYPEQLSARDFRGHQGIMSVGNGYTICTAVPLVEGQAGQVHEGPFSEYRAEVGIQKDLLRFRIKLDYAVKETNGAEFPPLHLRTMTVCRETKGSWPRAEGYTSAVEAVTAEALFGEPGAPG
jgi:hypothetical protein